jgi:transcriptional regulator with XRE-family HTH domain
MSLANLPQGFGGGGGFRGTERPEPMAAPLSLAGRRGLDFRWIGSKIPYWYMTGGNLILMSRRRAGLTQRELAERLGLQQATIARWERGDRRPSFEDVEGAAHVCGLQIDAHVAVEDRSWWPQIAAQLELSDPLERVRRLTPVGMIDLADRLEAFAATDPPVVLIGELAGALYGWPLVLNTKTIDVCARPGAALPTVAGVQVVEQPVGTWGYGDLARGAEMIMVGCNALRVAGVLDLLRIADASSRRDARRHALALRAVIDVLEARDGAAGRPERSDAQRLGDWLSEQTPHR